jgi:CubicO group peptidase (beta-lactamase class C family)
MKTKSVFLFLIILLVTCEKEKDSDTVNQKPTDSLSLTSLYQKIDSATLPYIEPLLNKVPGMVLGVVEDGSIVFRKAYGYAKLENNEKMTLNRHFRMCSNSKIFTGLSILVLANQGKVDLQDPVVDYIPDILNVSDPFNSTDTMKVLHLLTHRSGFPKEIMEMNMYEGISLEEVTEYIISNESLIYPVNDSFLYSNIGFMLAGRIVEVASGKSFHTFADEEVLQKLGMEESSFYIDDEIATNLTTSYEDDLTPNQITGNLTYWSAANLVSTLDDMHTFLLYLLQDENAANPLFDYSYKQQLFTDYGDNYGLGCYVFNSTVSHGGSLRMGYKCGFKARRNDGNGIVIMANGYNLSDQNRKDIYDLVYSVVY